MTIGEEIRQWMNDNDLIMKEAASWLMVELETLRSWVYRGVEPSAVELIRKRMAEYTKEAK